VRPPPRRRSAPANNADRAMIPIVLCVDVEPDQREPEPGLETRWDGWDWAYARFGSLRERLRTLTGQAAHFAWFLRIDPQIERLHGDAAFIARRDCARFDALHGAGDDIGLHPHFWRRDAEDRRWIADFADRAWVRRVISEAAARFRETLGFAPASFRAGDALIDNAIVRALAGLGIGYDLTVEPGRRPESWARELPRSRGRFPDLRRVSREPYRPARRDFRRAGRFFPPRLWVVPVSTTPLPGGEDSDFTALNLALPWNAAVFDAQIAGRAAPFLVVVLRAGDLAQPHWRANFETNLDTLLAHPRAATFTFVTPAALVAWHRAPKATRGGARKPDGGGSGNRPV